MLNKIRISLLFLILLGLNIPSMSQTISADLKKITENSDAIITGKVIDQKSEWNSDKTRIFTKVNIKVDEFLKGSAHQSTIIVIHPGGEVGEVGEIYSHVPGFFDNENVLLFLQKSEDNNSYKVMEGESGKISMTDDKQTSNKKNISAYKKQIKTFVEQ